MPVLGHASTGSDEQHSWSVTADDVQSTSPIFRQGSPFQPSLVNVHVKTGAHDGFTESSRINNSADTDQHVGKEDGASSSEGERWIWVLDPLTRKLRVPLSQLVPTQATATTGTVPSLCISFLEGRCRHQWCRQAHVLPTAIPQLRYEALHAPTCCRVHDDPHDTSVLTNRFKFIRVVNNGNINNGENYHNNKTGANDGTKGDASDLIPTDRVAQTVGLLRFIAHSVPPPKKKQQQHQQQLSSFSSREKSGSMPGEDRTVEEVSENCFSKNFTGNAEDDREDVLELPAKLICRLHLAHRCRYLEDCNNIHMCREYELRLQPPPHVIAALASVAPATRTITVGDTCYATTPLSVGEVSDETFRAICEQQRQATAQSSWTDSANAASHKSPLTYAGEKSNNSSVFTGARISPLTLSAGKWSCGNNGNLAPHSSPAVFPTRPEVGQSGNDSPFALGSVHGLPTPAGAHLTGRVLRIYDVRSKVIQSNSPSTKGVSAINGNTIGNVMKGGHVNVGGEKQLERRQQWHGVQARRQGH